jgi:hypothetical protein
MKTLSVLSLILIAGFLFSTKNMSGQAFTDINAGLLGMSGSNVSWGDFDNDDDLDVLLTGSQVLGQTKYTKIYRNNGNGTFTELTGHGIVGSEGNTSFWGDYNNDGYLDILIAGDGNGSKIAKIYKNNGNSTFTEQTSIVLHGLGNLGGAAWVDFNNDGWLDLSITGVDNSGIRQFKLYKNNGNNNFVEMTSMNISGL